MDHEDPSPGLGLLATELVLNIAKYSDVPTLAALASVNQRFHAIIKPVLYTADAENMSMAMIWGAKQNMLDIIKYSLSMRGNVNTDSRFEVSPYPMGSNHWHQSLKKGVHEGFGTPLHFAAMVGNDDIVRYLLENGANAMAESWYVCSCLHVAGFGRPKWIPLHHAICGGHLSTVQILMSHRRTHELDHVFEVRAVQSAAASGHSDILRYLLEDATAHEMADMRLADRNAVWKYAAQCYDHDQVIKCLPLLREYFPFDDQELHPGGQLHIHFAYACERGHFAMARFLVGELAPIQYETPFDESVFHMATRPPLEYRAAVPVHLAQSPSWYKRWNADRLAVIRTLVEHGAEIHFGEEIVGFTPLHGAAQAGDHELVEILVRAGADLNATDGDGKTPLMLAAIAGSQPTVSILLQLGALSDVEDNRGYTATDYAVLYYGNDIISF